MIKTSLKFLTAQLKRIGPLTPRIKVLCALIGINIVIAVEEEFEILRSQIAILEKERIGQWLEVPFWNFKLWPKVFGLILLQHRFSHERAVFGKGIGKIFAVCSSFGMTRV
jgi:hypothetical protein